MTQTTKMIDVRELIASQTVAEHTARAEEYFAKLTDWTFHLGKPFSSFEETPQLLVNFAVVLQGLELCPGLTVLEFGAGTCWASRMLTQLGCRVIAVDVSPTALKMGAELYAKHAPFGAKPEPEFLLFDGQRLTLPDASVDRIICLDAFHHVPNPAQVLAEMGRVLAPGGIAGFAEPGPEHSRSSTSQYEMRHHGVIENDVDIRALWQMARNAGFTDIKLAVFNQNALRVGLREFEDFVAGDTRAYAVDTRKFLQDKRNFFLYKGQRAATDSRFRAGLVAEILPANKVVLARADEPVRVQAMVRNTGASLWLPPGAGLGAVYLGFHVRLRTGEMHRESYHWQQLGAEQGVASGETVNVAAELPALPPGRYTLELDMVSNDVCWFALNGSPTALLDVDVL